MTFLDPSTIFKCLVYGPDKVQSKLKSLPKKIPSNHVLIRVHAAGLNPVDAKKVIGDKLPSFLSFLSKRVVQGSTIGFEFSGQIVSSSSEVTNDNHLYKVGDAVFGTMPPFGGTLSEYIVAPMDQICHMPTNRSDLSYAHAACLPLVGLTALQALRPYAPSSTDSDEKAIMIVGASGGTGHAAIQIAKALGWKEIIAVCSTKNLEFCRQMGATKVVDYTSSGGGNASEWWLDDTLNKVDVVLDCVTSADVRDSQNEYPQKLLPLCRTKYIRLGGQTMDWFYAGCERVLPMTCFRGKEKLFWIRFPQSSGELKQLAQWCVEGKLTPSTAREVDFAPEAVQHALEELLTRRVKGKLVVRVSSGDE
jgi:NADPH:quinone reductase-like Zn-dependent oxidoreductase